MARVEGPRGGEGVGACGGRSQAGNLQGLVTGELHWHDKQVVDPLPTKVETLEGGRTERGVLGQA